MSARQTFLSKVSKKSLVIFFLGVFFLFSTMGITSDISQLGRQPLLRFVLATALYSVWAVLYAMSGFRLRQKFWMATVPLLLAQFVLADLLRRWLPWPSSTNELGARELARLATRLDRDAAAIVTCVVAGYLCFLYTFIVEGRRYFRARVEIELAQEIHQVLVPPIDTKMGGFEFYGRSSPSGEVGGDLIDLAGAEGNWVAYLADVSGHGVAPGVVMGMAKSAARMLLTSGQDSDRLMPRLNEVLYPLKKPDMFITFCFVAANGNRLRAGLAGHPSILLFVPRTGETAEIQCPNLPLGILPGGEFAVADVPAESGTLLALYSDGFLEAANKAGEEFGLKRLQAELQKHGREPLPAICGAIERSVAAHGAQFDDQSILLIRKL